MANEIYNSTYWGNGVCDNAIDWGVVYKDFAGCTPSFSNTYSLSFDGVDDYVDTGITTLTGIDFSISYWFKTTATLSNFNYYVPFSANTNYQFTGAYLYFLGTLTVASKNSTGTVVKGTVDLSDGNWHHIVVTYNASSYSLKMYVDGSIDYDETISSINVFNQPLRLGGKTSTQYLINCSIDEASYFNSELTSANVTTIYNSGEPADISSLSPTSWYRMGDNGSYKSPQWLIPENSNKDKVSNYSFEFDGVGDYIDVGDMSQLSSASAITVSLWFNPAGNSNKLLLDFKQGSSRITVQRVSNSQIYLYVNTVYAVYNITTSTSNWYNLGYVFDGSGASDADRLKLYINGSEISASSFSGTVPSSIGAFTSAMDSKIGSLNNGSFSWLGSIDQVAIFTSAKSSIDITSIYNSGTPTTITGAVAYYKMGEEATFSTNWNIPDQVGSADGTSANMTIEDRVGNASGSTLNGISFNMTESDREEDTPS